MNGRFLARRRAQHVGIVVRRLGLVVEQAGAHHRRRLELLDDVGVEPVIEAHVAVGSKMKHLARAGADKLARHVAGGHHAVPGCLRDSERCELRLHALMRARRVGDHDHRVPRLARRSKRGGRRPEML